LELITSYYIRIKALRDRPSGSHAGDGSPAGSTPAPGTNGQQPKYAEAGGSKPAGILSAYGSRKDGMVSVSGQRCKPGDGFPDERLVMSINYSRI